MPGNGHCLPGSVAEGGGDSLSVRFLKEEEPLAGGPFALLGFHPRRLDRAQRPSPRVADHALVQSSLETGDFVRP